VAGTPPEVKGEAAQPETQGNGQREMSEPVVGGPGKPCNEPPLEDFAPSRGFDFERRKNRLPHHGNGEKQRQLDCERHSECPEI
jgi:hypothetical protein